QAALEELLVNGPRQPSEPASASLHVLELPAGIPRDTKLTRVGVAEALGRLVTLPVERERLAQLPHSKHMNSMLVSALCTVMGLFYLNDKLSVTALTTEEHARWQGQVQKQDQLLIGLRRENGSLHKTIASLQKENADLKGHQRVLSEELDRANEK